MSVDADAHRRERDTVESNMVLKILTYTWKVLQDRNSESVQLRLVADAGLHQYLRGMYRAERQHHFEPRANSMDLALMKNFHAGGSLALESEARN